MRLLLDATAVPPDLGGVGRYVDSLAAALSELGVDLVVACQQRLADGLAERVPAAEVVVAPSSVSSRVVRLAWEQAGLPALARRTGADVLHCPHYTMPVGGPIPVAVTLHDATFFTHPDLHSQVKARFFRAATRRAVAKAGALVVPSKATRDDVIRFAGGSPERFHVAYHGVDTAQFHPAPAAERDRVARSLGLEGKDYIAFLGTLEPRKNVPALVRAWARAVEELPDPPALVLAGGPGWDTEVGPALDAVPSGLTALRPGYLPLDDLAGYLSGATVVAYPSLGEGFGLPVLEAMACGATVLTTRELSLPEVGGDAVAYAGVDEASIALELRELLGDPARRSRLAGEAVARSRQFTWAAAAATHVEAYEQALRQAR